MTNILFSDRRTLDEYFLLVKEKKRIKYFIFTKRYSTFIDVNCIIVILFSNKISWKVYFCRKEKNSNNNIVMTIIDMTIINNYSF